MTPWMNCSKGAQSFRGNKHREGGCRGASRFRAAKLDRSFQLLEDAAADPQAETSSFIGLGGEKWLEYFVMMLQGNPGASIRDY